VPTITKAFAAATIPLNGTTILNFTIFNPNATPLSGLAFTDAMPAGLVVAASPGASNACGGTFTATAGSGSVGLSAGALAAGASCSASVNVTGMSAGAKDNTTGPIISNESGSGAPSNTATVTVIAPPTITKAFGNSQVWVGYSTTLSFTITNPNPTSALSGIGFTDTFPAGFTVATPNGLVGSCGSGAIAAAAGSGSVTLSGASLPAGGTCTFSVRITATGAGNVVNVTGAISSTETGPGATSNAAALSVALTPTPTPTLQMWRLLLLALGFGAIGMRRLSRAAPR
jgi:hypothetical protein